MQLSIRQPQYKQKERKKHSETQCNDVFFLSLLLAQAPVSWKQQQPSPPLLEKGVKEKKEKKMASWRCSLPFAYGRPGYCVLLLPSVGVSLQCSLERSQQMPSRGRVSAFRESIPGFSSATTRRVCFKTVGFTQRERERERKCFSLNCLRSESVTHT